MCDNMAKTISISNELYEKLKKLKAKGQSFAGYIEEQIEPDKDAHWAQK